MAKQPEANLSRKIMAALRTQGIFVFKVHGSEYMMAGLPDLIACVDGCFVGLEVKNPGQEHNTSARQEYVHTQITRAGGLVEVVTSVEQALDACRRTSASDRS